MAETLLLLGVFFALLVVGVPISFCLGIAALVTALYNGIGPFMIAQSIASKMQTDALLAIPLFILAGGIMARGGVARRIVDFAYVLVGWLPGGLAIVNCLDSMFFGGVSGSAVADIASTGPIMIPMMVEKGYDREFSTAITVASSTQGIIIPPSHNMVIYAMVAGGVSVGQLFLAGYIPGIMVGVFLAITCFFVALKRKYPREKMPPLKQALKTIGDGLLSMLAAAIIIGGMGLGVFTATEASAVAVVYAAFLGLFVYRELKLKDFIPIFKDAVKTTAIVFFLIGTASAFGWMMTLLRVPTIVTDFFLSVTHEPIVILLLINVLLLVLGCIMDVAPVILIVTPVLLPVVKAAGMSPVTFGIVLMVNMAIGLTTPPVGAGLFVGCTVGKTTLEKCSKSMLILWPAMFAVLLLITYVPWFTTFLPGVFVNAK
jgi:tripartite ATP-independent transporter DctM subunit